MEATRYEVGNVKIGDIVEHTGGYNCTQTQYYIVCGFSKTGKKVVVQSVPNMQVSGDWMNGNVAPNLSAKIDPEMHTLNVKTDYNGEMIFRGRINHIAYRGSLQTFYKWDGKPDWNNCD